MTELAWDIENRQWFAEYREVVHEDRVKVAGQTKAPDYSFRIGGQRKFFLVKEAMRAISRDQAGFEFCDASAKTGSLFRFDRPEDWAPTVHAAFAGQTVPAELVWDFVLNETLLVNAKAVLEKLENENAVTIARKPGARKRRDLHLMEKITFTVGPYVPARAAADDPEKGLFDGP